jgi:hypothetical protein
MITFHTFVQYLVVRWAGGVKFFLQIETGLGAQSKAESQQTEDRRRPTTDSREQNDNAVVNEVVHHHIDYLCGAIRLSP